MNRKKFLTSLGILTVAGGLKKVDAITDKINQSLDRSNTMGKFELMPLPYAFDALEPHIDAAQWKSITINTMLLM